EEAQEGAEVGGVDDAVAVHVAGRAGGDRGAEDTEHDAQVGGIAHTVVVEVAGACGRRGVDRAGVAGAVGRAVGGGGGGVGAGGGVGGGDDGGHAVGGHGAVGDRLDAGAVRQRATLGEEKVRGKHVIGGGRAGQR